MYVLGMCYVLGTCVCIGYVLCIRYVCTVCAKKTLLCTVRFTLDRLMKTEVKRLLNEL